MTTGRTFPYNLKSGIGKFGYTITITPADPITGQYPQITKKGFSSDKSAKSAMMEHLRNLNNESNHGKTKAVTLSDFASSIKMGELYGRVRYMSIAIPWTITSSLT